MNISDAKKLRKIKSGTDINARDKEKGYTALHWAAKKGLNNDVQWLLDNGADANIINNDGDTPLILAIKEGHTSIASLLIKHGADVDIRNNNGKTAMQVAQENGHTNVVNTITQAVKSRRSRQNSSP